MKYGCNVDGRQLRILDQALSYACETMIGNCCGDINNLPEDTCNYIPDVDNEEVCIQCWMDYFLDKAEEVENE